MPNQPQNSISWYTNVYFSYRDYPIKHLNTKYKKSQLKTIYNTLIKKMFNNFDISINNNQTDQNTSENSFTKKPLQDILNNIKHPQNYSQRNSQKSLSQNHQSLSSQLSIVDNDQHPQNQTQTPKTSSKESRCSHQQQKVNISSLNSLSQSSLSSSQNIQKSRQNIQPMRGPVKKLQTNINELIFQICQKTQDKNMDVLYELMIGMIRLTMKRITVEIDQQIKLTKQKQKSFEIIDEEIQKSDKDTEQDKESSFKSITQQSSSMINSEQSINSNADFGQDNNYKFVMSYSANLAEERKKFFKEHAQVKDNNKEKKKLIDSLEKQLALINFEYPSNLEQLKFSFLKYCLTTNVAADTNQNNIPQRNSEQKVIPSSPQQPIFEVSSFKQVTSESQKENESQTAKNHLNTYFTQITELDDQEIIKNNSKNSISEMQALVMKVANFQMKSFNIFVNHFFKKIQQASTIVNVIGLDAITDSMCQMALGKQARNNGIKTQVGLGNMQIKLFSNSVSQQNSNILLSTWADLILFTEDPQTLYEITQSLNTQSRNQKENKKKKAWTPSICSSPIVVSDKIDPQAQTIIFRQKLLSLMNFLILNTTKNIFLQSVTKANFLSLVITQILANRQDRRSLRQFELRPLKDSEIFKQKIGSNYFLHQDQAIIIYDLTFEKQVWLKESLDLIFSKWKKVTEIIFEEQIKNGNLYWQMVFEKCVAYINKHLSLLTVLIFSLVEIIQNLNLQIKFIIENQRINQAMKREIKSHEHMKNCIELMIKEFVGCAKVFGIDQTQKMGFSSDLFNKNFTSTNTNREFTDFEHGFKFINRQENAKQLIMWQSITKENILILQNYILNIELITKIFSNKPLHTALWVVNFHKQAKILMKKVKNQNLPMFFEKFYQKLPKLWQNLNAEDQQDRMMSTITKKGRGPYPRQRISSIKQKRQLSMLQKQALIVNYMIKAQLQLYESYTKSHVINCRQECSTMTTIVSGNSTLKSNRPFIFEDANIEALLIFNYKSSGKSQKGVISNNLFAKRNPKANLTLKPLSSFAPNPNLFTLSPRRSPQKQKPIDSFHKGNKHEVVRANLKQLQKIQVNEYEIDVSLLQTIQYTKEQIQFLKQLNSHLKFINQINFQYEFYYWKNFSYHKKFNLKGQESQLHQTENQQSPQQQISPLQTGDEPKQRMVVRLKKMVTYNDYAKQKTQKLLTTQQLFQQIAQISKNFIGTRDDFIQWPRKFDNQIEEKLNLVHHMSIQQSQRENVKNLYKQTIQEFQERIKIHNDSLLLIVKAALEAKNYWKAVSTNVFPDEDILNEQKQEYVQKNQNKLQKVTDYQVQIDFQERFFQKKILQKLEEYINYYREISEQMNTYIEQGKIKAKPVPEFDNQCHDGIQSKESEFNKDKSESRYEKNHQDSFLSQENDGNNNKKLSVFDQQSCNKQAKLRVYSLLEALICKKQITKMNRFEIAASIYQFSQKILRINCYMSSFYVQQKIYLDIISNQELSSDKYIKVKIIGKEYFDKIKQLSMNIYEDKQIAQQNLQNVKLIYQKKILIIMVSLLELIYYGNEHSKTIVGKWKSDGSDMKSKRQKFSTVKDINEKEFDRGYKNHGFKVRKHTIKKYSELLKKFLKYRFKTNTSQIFAKQGLSDIYASSEGDEQSKSDYFYISKLLSEVFEFGQDTEQFTEEKFVDTLRKLRMEQSDEEFLKFYIQVIEQQTQYLDELQTESEKVNCLKKKFNYLVLREIYFFLYYDVDCLEEKSPHSKKNYQLYENRILDFYHQIIHKSYQDFQIKKQTQLKKRSVYLQNYLLKYQEQPHLAKVQKNLNKLLVCVFNQVMLIYTQDIKMEIKKKSEQVQALNHKIKKYAHHPLHTHFLSSQFYQDKSLFRKKQSVPLSNQVGSKSLQNGSNMTFHNSIKHNESFSGASVNLLHTIFPNFISQQPRQSHDTINVVRQSITKSQKSQQSLSSNQLIDSQTNFKKPTFKIFTIKSMNLHQAINIYQKLKHKNIQAVQKYMIQLRQSVSNTKSLKRDDLTEMEIKTLETNEESIVSLLKRQIIQKINQLKFQLVQKNLISRIQKLYINLDVRHKVFESFKDKILSYEMQKAKIYHQYMDYIRGLKLDVYAHIANQDSLPYIKILNAIKFYRLQIKKEELENKVRQQFGKNLRKWNQGIQQDIENYNEWLESEQKQWENAKIAVDQQKNKFLLVYDSIKKQIRRQSKKKQLQQQRIIKNTAQMIKTQFQNSVNELKKNQKPTKQLKKIGLSKKNLFMAQKQRLDKLLELTPQSQTKLQQQQQKEKPKYLRLQNQSAQQNVFQKAQIHSKRPFTAQIVKSHSLHTLHRSLSKHSTSNKLQRPKTSVHSQVRLSYATTGMKSKSRDINRASTAVTRQKSFDVQGSEFRGIKMKFISKSFEKFMSCAQSVVNEQKNFKRSIENSTLQGQRTQQIYGNGKSRNITINPSILNNQRERNDLHLKSRTLLKQARTINSAMPQRKGIIKNI